MRVGTNVAAVNAGHGFARTQDKLSMALERLSSGLRVNNAGDDAGGLAVSEALRAKVRGSAQARRNAQEGLNLINTAEGATDTIHGMLQRMRELAVQAANGTYTTTQRTAMQAEVTQIIAEIDRLATSTEFNDIKVLQTTPYTAADYALVQNNLQNSLLGDAWQIVAAAYPLLVDGPARDLNVFFDTMGAGGTLAYVSASGSPFYPSLELHVDMDDFLAGGGLGSPPLLNDRILAHELVHALMFDQTNYTTIPTWFAEGIAEFAHGADERIAADLAALGGDNNANRQTLLGLAAGGWGGTSADYSGATMATRFLDSLYPGGIQAAMLFLEDNNSPTAFDDMLAVAGLTQASFSTMLTDGTALAWANANLTLGDADTGSILGSDYTASSYDENTIVPNGTGTDTPWNEIYNPPTTTPITLQVGGDFGETLQLAGIDASAGGLGVDAVSLTTIANARSAISTVDGAIGALSQLRSTLGAQANRLEGVVTTLATDVENQMAAESRIRDADMAAENVQLVRSQILARSGTAMMAAANARPQSVLALLRAVA